MTDRQPSPTAHCRSDDLPFHIILRERERHKHDIAPNHTDGDAATPGNIVDVDDVYEGILKKKSHRLH